MKGGVKWFIMIISLLGGVFLGLEFFVEIFVLKHPNHLPYLFFGSVFLLLNFYTQMFVDPND